VKIFAIACDLPIFADLEIPHWGLVFAHDNLLYFCRCEKVLLKRSGFKF